MKKLILFGDSLLANCSKRHVVQLEQLLEGQYDVYNCAVGGWDTNDLIKKSPYISALAPDVLVLSIGTNDASPWKRVGLNVFKTNLAKVLDIFKDSRVIFLLPPPIHESWGPPEKSIPNNELKEYCDSAK